MFSKFSNPISKTYNATKTCNLQRIISNSRGGILLTNKKYSDGVTQSNESSVSKADGRPRTNVPFAKNLFLGRLDKRYLNYPEVTVDQLNDLQQMVQPIEKYFLEELDSKTIDVNAKISEKTLQDLKDLGLFGQQIPPEYGGLGLNATEYARLAEITALDGSIAVTLAAHQAIGLKGILIAGTEAQKEKYLPKLATGEHVAAFCLTEPSSGSDAASIKTRATLSEDGKKFYLNGGKIWISNGGIAEVFTVFAKTEIEKDGKKVDKVTAFIVERGFGGVTSGKPEDKLGIRGSNTCEIHFDNTPIPMENVLGEVGGGFKIAMQILNSGRFSMGSSGAGILKRLIAMTAEHATTRTQFGKYLSEFDLIKEKFAKMAVTVYAMESMAYMTAGIIDGVKEPDCSVEAAMVKVFSSEGCWTSVNECLQILGGLGYMKDYPFERYLRDGRILMIFEGTNEILRMYIALTGLDFAGKELSQLVKKLRNPLQNPGLLVKTMVNRVRKQKLDTPMDSVHPTFEKQVIELQSLVILFKKQVEYLLQRYGKNVVNEQIDLKRIADISIDIYAIVCCLSRASRSYSIGLKNATQEVQLTKAFCHEAVLRIDNNCRDLQIGKEKNNDEVLKSIADKIFQDKAYPAAHPLDRMW